MGSMQKYFWGGVLNSNKSECAGSYNIHTIYIYIYIYIYICIYLNLEIKIQKLVLILLRSK